MIHNAACIRWVKTRVLSVELGQMLSYSHICSKYQCKKHQMNKFKLSY